MARWRRKCLYIIFFFNIPYSTNKLHSMSIGTNGFDSSRQRLIHAKTKAALIHLCSKNFHCHQFFCIIWEIFSLHNILTDVAKSLQFFSHPRGKKFFSQFCGLQKVVQSAVIISEANNIGLYPRGL